jgi:hypothetical protein
VYQAVHVQSAGAGKTVEWHLAKSDTVAKDTRIPPKGFSAGPTTAVIGADYGDGAGGFHNYDEQKVTFDGKALGAATTGKLQVKATVYNQSTERALVAELVKANTKDDRGTKLQAAYDATGKAAPVPIASGTASFDFTAGASGDAGTDAAFDSATDTGTPAATPPASESGGCGCVSAGVPVGASAALGALSTTLLLAIRRRRNRRPSRMA